MRRDSNSTHNITVHIWRRTFLVCFVPVLQLTCSCIECRNVAVRNESPVLESRKDTTSIMHAAYYRYSVLAYFK